MRTTLDHLSTAAAPGRCRCSWAAIAVCATVDRRGARPRPSGTRRRRWSTGAGRSRPTTTSVGRPARSGLSGSARRRAYPWHQPASPATAGGRPRTPAKKFPGLGYPDLDKLATHELTLPGRLLASAVLPAKMASFSKCQWVHFRAAPARQELLAVAPVDEHHAWGRRCPGSWLGRAVGTPSHSAGGCLLRTRQRRSRITEVSGWWCHKRDNKLPRLLFGSVWLINHPSPVG